MLYAGYSLWDNAHIYQAAENVGDSIRQLKPKADAEGGPTFDELRKINPDVCAWLTVDGTNIDYPVLQGETNLEYMDKDVYGQFSLAGSIFLDTRNKNDFSDAYSLIYGHHMAEHLMFGDLDLFFDKDFFNENTTATLMLPGESRAYGVLAALKVPAGTEEIINPDKWNTGGLVGFAAFLRKNSTWFHELQMELLEQHPGNVDIVTLVTCSSGGTNERSVLVLIRYNPDRKTPTPEPTPEPTPTPETETETETPETPAPTPESESESEPETKPTNTDPSHRTPSTETPTPETSSTGIPGTTSTPGNDVAPGTDTPKTADTRDPNLWKGIILGTLVFIFIVETTDRRRRRKFEEEDW